MSRVISVICTLLFMSVSQSCGVYSLSGNTLNPAIQTVSIANFYNDSGGGPANLSQTFTEEIRDYYQTNTSLSLVSSDGDLQLDGSIVSWTVSPLAPQATGSAATTDVAGQERLTIGVKVIYVNTLDEDQNFERNFSFYADFDPARNTLTEVENQLIETIFDQIIFDIFNATVANW
ncbi:LPS assembly lipoprotein LptE [Roseivirga sp. BDSF3-8]|uniref:LPS assembly lipoprotein LptE n=1 Tax=Roseivirga sp. BDSF3-8 TaxID=3241598 RepID=UPI0035318FF1